MRYLPVKILIIDDDTLRIHRYLKMLPSDHQVQVAKSADVGMKLAQANSPDVILLTDRFADSDGFVMCHRLKGDRRTHSIPVLMVSCDPDEATQARGFELGAADFISWPTSPLLLKARVNAHARAYRQSRQLESQSTHDPLTGVANRQQFEQTLHMEVERCNRSHTALCLLTLDIDDFDAYNDHYGYGMGEQRLMTLARILGAEAGRCTDLVCRIDTEEFAVLLPGTSVEGARKLASAIQDEFAIKKIESNQKGKNGFLTVSVGAAVVDYQRHQPGALDAGLMLRAAGAALQDARAKGMNKMAWQFVVSEH
ncbi:GGDEF domain-containing response regulator [Alteromonas aestuariivivens]|nr:diguanylate cyclase [Alteromonas aestuariivivens]